ncbi:MAG: hypothetical protein HS111_02955 [Kofleriaceae bacterium]|nr:hypothetical protein [Kofleriaceae bacterium]
MERPSPPRPSSRIAGFYQRPLAERVATVAALGDGALSPASAAWLRAGGGLDLATADRMSENVIATAGLPLSLALNLRVNQVDHLVPMAVEEPSVVAAASAALAAGATVGTGPHRRRRPSIADRADRHVDGVDDASQRAQCADRRRNGARSHRAAAMARRPRERSRMVTRGGGCLLATVARVASSTPTAARSWSSSAST